MFAVRGIGVSLAVFALLYLALSLAVSYGWGFAQRFCGRLSAQHAADLLFVLRMMPLAVAVAVTVAYTVPSFLLLEPAATDETMGAPLLALGLACLGLLGAGIMRTVSAQRKTSHALAAWLNGARALDSGQAVPVFQTGKDAPTLTVAGVYAPQVLISETALAVLTEQELRTALRHEIAHVQRYDNLKKLLFRFSVFPGMKRLEAAWSEAAELAADDAAVSSFSDALDLAAALIKLSRFAPVQPAVALTTGLLHTSVGSLSLRIKRLFAWNSQRSSASPRSWWYAVPAIVAAAICVVSTYEFALYGMHEFTELLVR
jgi:Zn-dependent protease with chaperone function